MSATLEAVTQEQIPHERWSRPVAWYRTPVDTELLKSLHQRSNFRGFVQALGYLGVLVVTGSLAFYALGRWPWWVVVLLVFLHGTCSCFHSNAVHELGHGTVFRTRWLNSLFQHISSFLEWGNCHMFDTSHVRHHQFTLHPPDDLEVPLPIRIKVKHFFQAGFVNPLGVRYKVTENLRIARGKMRGEWELALFPESDLKKRRLPMLWSRTVLIGHGLIIGGSIAAGFYDHRFWILPLLISFTTSYGAWLFWLCNNTQHIGLQDNVPDFRLCCRTIRLNPVVQFLYWHMNYHTEHHMYAAVPCYRLGKLHRAIKHDIPVTHGLIGAWREIAAIQKIQDANPTYQHVAVCPNPCRRMDN